MNNPYSSNNEQDSASHHNAKYLNSNNQFAFNSNRVNKMPDEQLIGTLKYHGLNPKGSPEVLRKRLKEFMKRQMNSMDDNSAENLYSYFLIIDFEATCDETNGISFQHEIIEFPIILYDVVLRRKVDVFHSYCRPNVNPALTVFCKRLTNIHQTTVDESKSFQEVLSEVEQWLNKHHMFAKSFAVVCDCNADMAKFMRIQCQISGLDFPTWCKQWINITKSFRQFYKVASDLKLNMQKMLNSLGLEFEGRQHSGLNDAENILRITETMIRDGCSLRINEKLDMYPPYFTASVTRKEAEMCNTSAGGGGGYCWTNQHQSDSLSGVSGQSECSGQTVYDEAPIEPAAATKQQYSHGSSLLGRSRQTLRYQIPVDLLPLYQLYASYYLL